MHSRYTVTDGRRLSSLLTLVSVCVATTAAACAAAVPKPPVIHETFTRLPCPKHAQTTIAREACIENAILGTDREINAKVSKIFVILPKSARAPFAGGERKWLSYRKASCAAQAALYAGGSEQPVIVAACMLERNRTHLRDLAMLEHTLRPH